MIKLREPLDREVKETIEVVLTIQDEAFNLIPFRREIRGNIFGLRFFFFNFLHLLQSIPAYSRAYFAKF